MVKIVDDGYEKIVLDDVSMALILERINELDKKLMRTEMALDIARQWIEDKGVQKQIDGALEGRF